MQEQQRRLNAFTPAYKQLVTMVVQHVRYPADYRNWHKDELQEFKHNRYAISETLEDAAGQLPHTFRSLPSQFTGLLSCPVHCGTSLCAVVRRRLLTWHGAKHSLCCSTRQWDPVAKPEVGGSIPGLLAHQAGVVLAGSGFHTGC